MSGLANAIAKPFKDAYNKAKEWLNKIPGLGGGMPSISVPKVNIPFFHDGGIFKSGRGGEGPAMLRDGEGVFTPGQMAALGQGLGGRGGRTQRIELVVSGSANSWLVEAIRHNVTVRGGGDVQVAFGR